jgi:hypothetical protein
MYMKADVEVTVDISTLYLMLEEHNWDHWDSKDPNVYQEGADWWAMILKHADTPEKKRLVADFEKHIHSGVPYGSEKFPKPERI